MNLPKAELKHKNSTIARSKSGALSRCNLSLYSKDTVNTSFEGWFSQHGKYYKVIKYRGVFINVIT